jgi:hypothetical protein
MYAASTYIVKELDMLLQHCLPHSWLSPVLLWMEAVWDVERSGGACTTSWTGRED